MQELNTHKFSWTLFAIQQVSVPLLSLFGTYLLAVLLTGVNHKFELVNDIIGIMIYVSTGLFGFLLGVVASSLGATFKQTGRRIWIAPVLLFVVAFLWELFSDWRQVIPEFFGVRGGETEEGILAMLITFPTAACGLYSVGISLRKVSAATRDTDPL